jgi:hypothetical protein
MARLSEYKNDYPDKLLQLMSDGRLDCEIFSELNLSKSTFYRYLKEYPEFKEAYEQGLPRCESWWVRRMREKWENGDEKGFKYCALIVNTKFGYRDNQSQGTTNNTQINIQGNMNVLQNNTKDELIDTVTTNFEFLMHNNILPEKISNDGSPELQKYNKE